jgi:RNA 2',3'-cyclic 3'-phosphodiesterase
MVDVVEKKAYKCGMTRVFIALELDTGIQRRLSGVIDRMARELPALRWVDPLGIHLTVAFLGELSNERVEEAIQATSVAARQVAPFDYRLTRLGVFGGTNQPRVIWMGVEEPTGSLARLHETLKRALQQRGFELETRPFSPHLTLSRVKNLLTPDEQQTLRRLLNDGPLNAPSPLYHVTHVSVMKSELSRTGAKYTCLRDCALGG